MTDTFVQKSTVEKETLIKDLVRTMSKAAINTDPEKKRDNTLDAVVALLTGLLDADSTEILKAAGSSSGKGTKGTSESMGVGGIGASGAGSNKFLPSFNLRTPVVEVEINGNPIYPNKLDLDTGNWVDARLNFEDFKLSFPMGGVEKSISGSIQLFAKDPKEILIPLDSWNEDGSFSGNNFGSGGFPIVTLRFGWAFSDSTALDKISKAMSPKLTFIATNIGMSDPGASGTTFTLTLQEIGTTILTHSTDDVLLLSNYPQEQLRVLLEGLLHVRLFTLDDLLYLGEKNKLGNLALSLSQNTKNIPTLPRPVVELPTTVAPKAIDVNAAMSKAEADSLLKTNPATVPAGFSVFGMPINKVPTVSDATKPVPQNNLQSSTPDYINKAADDSFKTASTPTTLPESDLSINQSKTFFVTKPSAALGINSRTFFTVAKELASQCRCKWYPHDNTNDAVNRDVSETSEASTKLTNLAKDLKMVRDTNGDILTKELSTKIRKSFDEKNTDTTTLLNKSKAEQDLIAELKRNMARIATRSKLFWVPHIPAEWNTTGSAYYASGEAELGESPEYEPGAFFLLPDVLDDYDIFLQDLPVQYGPGASALPYFYSSAQNVFQTSLSNTNSSSKLFGEVQTLAVNHSNLIVALSQATKENLAYAVNGERMGQLEAAQGITTNKSKSPNNTLTKEDYIKQHAAADKRGAELNQKGKETQKVIRKTFRSLRFNGSCGTGSSGTLTILDSDKLSGTDKSLPNSADPLTTKTGPAQSITYNIKSRVSNFLRYPTQAKITILGDPNLIRLGPGCFELISYYPVQHDDGSVTHEINALTSGIYFVDLIEHSVSGGSFTTTLNGSKLVDPHGVPSSFTNKLITQLASTKEVSKTTPNKEDKIKTLPPNNLSVVDLTTDNFTSGFLANELRTIFNDYKTYQNKEKGIKRTQ